MFDKYIFIKYSKYMEIFRQVVEYYGLFILFYVATMWVVGAVFVIYVWAKGRGESEKGSK